MRCLLCETRNPRHTISPTNQTHITPSPSPLSASRQPQHQHHRLDHEPHARGVDRDARDSPPPAPLVQRAAGGPRVEVGDEVGLVGALDAPPHQRRRDPPPLVRRQRRDPAEIFCFWGGTVLDRAGPAWLVRGLGVGGWGTGDGGVAFWVRIGRVGR